MEGNELSPFQRVNVEIIAVILKCRHRVSAIFTQSNLLLRGFLLGRWNKRRGSAKTIIALSIGWVEGHAAGTRLAEMLNVGHD